jgi:hypothetical protein
MNADPTERVTVPAIIDTAAIEGDVLHIHPEDLDELHDLYRFCWPNNAPADVWKSTTLIVDPAAPRLPLKPL